MQSDWKYTTLGDLVDVKQGLAINAKSKHLIVENGLPLLRITDLLNNTQIQFINDKEAPVQCIANYNDLIYTRTGQVGYIFRKKIGVVHNNCFRIIPKDDSTTRGFLYWFLSQKSIRKYANDISSGSVQKDLNHSAFYSIPISIPNKATQLKIEKILNSIEDKIELNRKMNQTLEDMAQALFKSWFVDFEPTHALANKKDDEDIDTIASNIGISKEVLELFPSEFEESELGMIPKGWEWKLFGEVMTPKKGKVITKKTITDGEVPVIAGGLSPAYYHNQYNVTSPVITISASGANAGFVKLYNQNIWASDCSYINKEITDFVYSSYLFLKLNQKNITRMQQGAAQPHIYPSHLMRLNIANPNTELWTYLEEIVEPIFKQIKNNEEEIQTLQKTRDTLLPKLLSGEIEV